jgi:hypothetical protein
MKLNIHIGRLIVDGIDAVDGIGADTLREDFLAQEIGAALRRRIAAEGVPRQLQVSSARAHTTGATAVRETSSDGLGASIGGALFGSFQGAGER